MLINFILGQSIQQKYMFGRNKLEWSHSIFEGTMDAVGYINVLKSGLLPFINSQTHVLKFMQDSDPKHTSMKARE